MWFHVFETNNNKKNIGSFEMEIFFNSLLFLNQVSRFYPSSISKYLATFFLPVVCARRFSQLVPYQLNWIFQMVGQVTFPVLFQDVTPKVPVQTVTIRLGLFSEYLEFVGPKQKYQGKTRNLGEATVKVVDWINRSCDGPRVLWLLGHLWYILGGRIEAFQKRPG